ncbi:hypothetical protein HPB49_003102 [Dermacentor silvarum]|uniref:Uncharacterized protein n=1 Tax=Dermacentor silvarum TaxID=543639 RepID=A0ACB8DA06_DERSI|nr:hypothetical protein HPB49_003102 [Dermacentor silvarum]
MLQFWHDHRLTWNKEEYDNRTFIHVHKKEVWSPDVDIVNAKTSDFDSVKCLLTVQPDGTVWSCSSSKFTLPCPIDTREFPTDKQVCTAHLTSTTYGDTEVKLVKGIVWGRYQEDASTEWNITGISYANHTALNRSFLDVSFHFRRLSKRHHFAVTVPLVAASLVMLAAFWVPPGCDCRLTLAGQSLLSLALVMDRTTPILRSFAATSYIRGAIDYQHITQAEPRDRSQATEPRSCPCPVPGRFLRSGSSCALGSLVRSQFRRRNPEPPTKRLSPRHRHCLPEPPPTHSVLVRSWDSPARHSSSEWMRSVSEKENAVHKSVKLPMRTMHESWSGKLENASCWNYNFACKNCNSDVKQSLPTQVIGKRIIKAFEARTI